MHLPGPTSHSEQLFIVKQNWGPQTERVHGDGAEEFPAGNRHCLGAEAGEVPSRISKTLEIFYSYSFYTSISWQPCSPSSSILSLATGRWQTESVCLGLCPLCLAALGNPADFQHPSRRRRSSLTSSHGVTSSTPSFLAVAGVSAALVFVRKTDGT